MSGEPSVVRIMVVDDQQPFRAAARAVVDRLEGFELVVEAESGDDAVAVSLAHRPDLILMDINMPGMTGIEATRAIVAAQPGSRVVLVSTYDVDDLPADAKTCGAIAYLNKDDFGIRALRRLWEQHSGS